MNASIAMFRVGLLSAAVALAVLPQRVSAQEMDHSKMNMPMPAAKPVPAKNKPVLEKPVAKPAATPASSGAHAGHGATAVPKAKAKPAPAMDHSAMGHDMPMPTNTMPTTTAPPAEPMDHSAMGHDMAEPGPETEPPAQEMDHAAMGHDMGAMPSESAQPMDHSAMAGMTMAPTEPITPIPVLTDADRAAAAPPPGGHAMHDNSVKSYVLFDRLEVWNADPGTGLEWEGQSWIGTDLNRLWVRSEGERIDGRTESADLEVLYGRSVAAWWDVVAGIRHDFKPGASQDFAAIGVMGLAPYKFELEATAYIGQSGQTAARVEAEYETLLTNRLILQPLVEVNFYGQSDERRGIGSGLSTVEAGLRLRYEVTRQFAPYIGIVRERVFGDTADFRRAEGEDIDDTRFVAGLRIWF